MPQENPLPPIQRLVTTHNEKGEAIFSDALDPENQRKFLPEGDAAFALGYLTRGFPVELSDDADIETFKPYLQNPPGIIVSDGTVLRFVDMAPGHVSPMHRTVSLDYGVVIEGDIELILDSGEKRPMKRGDIAIQRGTNHAWRNTSSTSWARMMYILQPAKPISIGGKALGESLGGMTGVRSSD